MHIFNYLCLIAHEPSYVCANDYLDIKICYIIIYVSQFTVETYIVLLTVGVYSSNHRVLYTIGISMTRRFQKSVGPSVCLSVCPFVTLTKNAYSFIIDSRKISRISGETVKGLTILYKKMMRYFQKNIFQKF